VLVFISYHTPDRERALGVEAALALRRIIAHGATANPLIASLARGSGTGRYSRPSPVEASLGT
jgi:hypothetical protein